MANTVETGRNTTLNQKINSSDSNTTITMASVPWAVTTGVIEIGVGNNKEWASFTGVSSNDLTGVTMGFNQDATTMSSSTTANKNSHAVGTQVRLVNHSIDINNKFAKDGNNTVSGANTYTGINNFDDELNIPIYANAAARDAAITSPREGSGVKLTTEGVITDYLGGAWVTRTADTTANASTTVAGRVEMATAAERAAGTAAGGTGALLVPTNDALVKTSSGSGDENKIPLLNSSGQFDSGFIGDVNPTESLTTGENVTAGNALRMKVDGTVYKAMREAELGGISRLFTSPSERNIATAQIDDNKIVYCYIGGTNYNARVVTWDGEKATLGSATLLLTNTVATGKFDVVKIDTNKFALVTYLNSSTNGVAVVSTVSGSTITAGSSVAFETGAQTGSSLHKVSSSDTDVFTVAWEDDGTSDQARARTATVSGTVPTFGTEIVVSTDTDSGAFLDTCDVAASKIVVAYKTSGNALVARVSTISGNTMTQGTEVTLDATVNSSSNTIRCAKVEDDKFIVSYLSSNAVKIVVCTASGTVITAGTPITLNPTVLSTADITYLESFADGKVAMTYQSGNEGDDDLKLPYTAAWVTVSGTVPTVKVISPLDGEGNYREDAWGTDDLSLVKINDDRFQFVLFESVNDDIYTLNISDNNFMGYADTTVTSGNPVVVNIKEDDNQSSLATGAKYWLDASGAISLNTGRVFAGTAVSTSKIIRN